MPEALGCEDGDLPPDRHEHIGKTEADARRRVNAKWVGAANEDVELEDKDDAAFRAESDTEAERAGLEAAALWDEWHARACAAVDALQVPDSLFSTLSNVSTSRSAEAPS